MEHLGTIEATTAGFPGSLKKIELTGSRGTAILEEEDIIKWEFAETNDDDAQLRQRCSDVRKQAAEQGTQPRLDTMPTVFSSETSLSPLSRIAPPCIDGAEGMRSVDLILAIYESAKTGKRVELAM